MFGKFFIQRLSSSWTAIAIGMLAAMVSEATWAQTRDLAPEQGDVRNLAAEQAQVNDGTLRIVHGTIASLGAWPSMVSLHHRDRMGHTQFCGGTLIDPQWVLTAAHCVIRYRQEANKLFVREGTNMVNEGRALNVASIVMHEDYQPSLSLNDLALLHLAAPARSARQMLLPDRLRSEYLQDRKISTVIGYGLVNAQSAGQQTGPSSERLLQVDLPLVAQPRCADVLGSNKITAATVCAGYDDGGRDSCNGDSGGPLFIRSGMFEPVQIGVVSWGRGCAQPKDYGVYTSIGYFEGWIKRHVPGASFFSPVGSKPLQTYVGNKPVEKPSALAQVTIDVSPGQRIKIGDVLKVRITSSVAGQLFLFNQETDGKGYQIFPNRLSGSNLPGQARPQIGAGQSVEVPGPTDRFILRIKPPTGRNKVIALIVPPEVRIDDLAQKNAGLEAIENFDAFLESIVDREQATRGVNVEEAPPMKRAVAIREYEIIP